MFDSLFSSRLDEVHMRRDFNVINFCGLQPLCCFCPVFCGANLIFLPVAYIKRQRFWGIFRDVGFLSKWGVWTGGNWGKVTRLVLSIFNCVATNSGTNISSFHSKMFYWKANDLGYYPFFGKHLYPLQVVGISLDPSRSLFIFTTIFTIIQFYDAWFPTECFLWFNSSL